MAARRAASGAHDADPAFGQALFTQVPVPWRLAPVYEHHHVLVQAQPQIRIHLASEQRAAQVHSVHDPGQHTHGMHNNMASHSSGSASHSSENEVAKLPLHGKPRWVTF